MVARASVDAPLDRIGQSRKPVHLTDLRTDPRCGGAGPCLRCSITHRLHVLTGYMASGRLIGI